MLPPPSRDSALDDWQQADHSVKKAAIILETDFPFSKHTYLGRYSVREASCRHHHLVELRTKGAVDRGSLPGSSITTPALAPPQEITTFFFPPSLSEFLCSLISVKLGLTDHLRQQQISVTYNYMYDDSAPSSPQPLEIRLIPLVSAVYSFSSPETTQPVRRYHSITIPQIQLEECLSQPRTAMKSTLSIAK